MTKLTRVKTELLQSILPTAEDFFNNTHITYAKYAVGSVITAHALDGAWVVMSEVSTDHDLTVNGVKFGVIGNDLRAFGKLDGVTNASPVVEAAVAAVSTVRVPAGTFTLGTRVGEVQAKPFQLIGSGVGTTLHVDNSLDTGLRLGAIGGNDEFGGARTQTTIRDLNWTSTANTLAAPTTAIDAQSINPLYVLRNRFYGLTEAVKLRRMYYGGMDNCDFVKSGLTLQNVNNFHMTGGGFFGGAADLPSATSMFGSGFVIDADKDDVFRGPEGVSFERVVFESWTTNLARWRLSNMISFTRCWFEALTGDYMHTLNQCRRMDFIDCKFDLAYPDSSVPFLVNNDGPSTDDDDIRESGVITVNRGEWRALPSRTDSVKVVEVNSDEAPTIRFDGTTLTRGHLFSDASVVQDIQRLHLASDDQKSFYSTPNASIDKARNSWLLNNASTDWDFTGGANFTETTGSDLTITTGTTGTDLLTGTRSAKISGYLSDGAKRTIERTASSLGFVPTEGLTYAFFVRIKSTTNITLEVGVRGFNQEYSGTPEHTLPANTWRDILFKTPVDGTFAQNGPAFGGTVPKLFLHVTNNSGAVADVVLDRVDYQVCDGDLTLS